MQVRVRWTTALDEQLKALRAAGLTWDAVALERRWAATRYWSVDGG